MLSGDHALLEGNVFEPSKPQISPFVELNGISLSKPDVSYSYLDKVNEEIAESSHAHVSKLIVEEDHVTPFISVSSPKPTVNRITNLSTKNVENVSQNKLDNPPKPIFVGTNTKLECQIADALNDKSTKTTTPTKDSLNPIALESVRTKDSLNPIALQPAPTKDSLNPIALQPATKDSLDPISQMKMNRGYSYLNPIRFVIAVLVGIVLKVNESFIKAMLGKKDHRDVDLPDLVDEPLTSRNVDEIVHKNKERKKKSLYEKISSYFQRVNKIPRPLSSLKYSDPHQLVMSSNQNSISSKKIEDSISKSNRFEFLNYYEILGVSPLAKQHQISSAFKKLALRYHPDKSRENNDEYFKKIVEAYNVLNDDKKRVEYNQLLRITNKSPIARDILGYGAIFARLFNIKNNYSLPTIKFNATK
ncbi:DnaJ domain-containing protein [Rozella allomycis CSF55]|uniref:DnaJ domain-containing protein n=1 Tax=Rozella allomycis (strain CSF55) TaxID=988480 RepID=A0A075AUW7_ROZAC|nr:DnaJ domain-containing protein [Rozella allomycis CSF55]|eukprot:EPZ32507.1 DnaJ domain-containing protein [Rozella allomycis CSF55]